MTSQCRLETVASSKQKSFVESRPSRHCEVIRSEEHTSELQSLAYLVCRLLLEKKKKTRPDAIRHTIMATPRQRNRKGNRDGSQTPRRLYANPTRTTVSVGIQ